MIEEKEIAVLSWTYKESSDNFHQYVLGEDNTQKRILRFEHKQDYDAVAKIGETKLFFEKELTIRYHMIKYRNQEIKDGTNYLNRHPDFLPKTK